MSGEENGFRSKLRATFKVEADEHVRNITSGLVHLEKAGEDERPAIIETVFREAHSLKGSARIIGATAIESVCQSLEDVFSAVRRKELDLSPAALDVVHLAVDLVGELVARLNGEPTIEERSGAAEVVKLLQGVHSGEQGSLPPHAAAQPAIKEAAPAEAAPSAPRPPPPDTVRIAVSRLEQLMLQTEELLAGKLAADQLARDLRSTSLVFDEWHSEWRRVAPEFGLLRYRLQSDDRPETQPLKQQIARLLEFVDWNRNYFGSLEGRIGSLAAASRRDHRSLESMIDLLTRDMRQVLLSPFSTVVEGFPRLVRDLSREQGKELDLLISGQEVEIDRRLLEEMRAPLTHLVRNCVDHGIETPEERERTGKSRRGTITLAISQKGSSHVEIAVGDDGRGIDVPAVRQAAVKRGVISPEEAAGFSESEALDLIFQSGVSTSPVVTGISGRGLGLAIVQEKVEKLRGAISVETGRGRGSTMRIVLPLSLAEFQGLVVMAGDQVFVLPAASVERAVRVKRETIRTVENRETIEMDGQAVSLVRLADVLEMPRERRQETASNHLYVLIVGQAGVRLAFSVDEVLGQQEVLVKGLGKQLSRVRNVAGATILASGKVVPVLNVSDLVKSAITVQPLAPIAATPVEPTSQPSILVVEDSITARTLLKNILESDGYRVRTAVDGVDALSALKTGNFDLVVSDVDMPRMNGFDLTSRIRGDKKLAALPVVLVTALESREQRERGIDVGASAYIVKSSFDQGNLLETIRSLL